MNKLLLSLAVLSILAITPSSGSVCTPVVCTGNNLNVNGGVGEKTICALKTTVNGAEQIQVNTCFNDTLWCYGVNSLLNPGPNDDGTHGNCLFKHSGGGGAGTVLPGNQCATSIECGGSNGTCKNTYCLGLPFNSACTQDVDCDVGLFCLTQQIGEEITGICQYVSKKNGPCDVGDNRCGYGLMCVGGKCTNFLSIPVNTTMPIGNYFQFSACSSLTTLTIEDDPANVICAPAPMLNGPQLVDDLTTACTYTIPGQTQPIDQTIEPTCEFSQQGKAICPLGLGDVQEDLNYIYTNYFINDLSYVCHIDQSPASICRQAQVQLGTTKVLQAYLDVYGYSLGNTIGSPFIETTSYLADNAPCVKTQVTYQFWNAFADSASILSMGAALIVGLILSLF